MIGVVDSKICNIYSLTNMLKKIGANYKVVTTGDELSGVDKIIMPGVGAFPKAIENLTKSGMKDVIIKMGRAGTPVLGICLGMQLLFDQSDEFGLTNGLGLIPGRVRKIKTDLTLPHMGWNDITIDKNITLLNSVDTGADVYFVHSFIADTNADYIASHTVYGENIPAVVCNGNIYGAQFHPEKSQKWGEIIMRNFCFKV